VCVRVFSSKQSVSVCFCALCCGYDKICRQDKWMRNTYTGILVLSRQSKKLMLLFRTHISTAFSVNHCILNFLSVIFWPSQPFVGTPLELLSYVYQEE
jgi:hypothetical protein